MGVTTATTRVTGTVEEATGMVDEAALAAGSGKGGHRERGEGGEREGRQSEERTGVEAIRMQWKALEPAMPARVWCRLSSSERRKFFRWTWTASLSSLSPCFNI
jgi:hypothetical protein